MQIEKFLKIREEILTKIYVERKQYRIRRKREEKVKRALQELKKEKAIRDFLWSGVLTFSDIVKGIDFYIVTIDRARYRIHCIDVTGPLYVKNHKKKHPERIVIPVELGEEINLLKRKILKAIGLS